MSSDLENAILGLVKTSGYKPAKPRVIAKNLGLKDDAARQAKKTIKKLVKEGKLAYGPNHLVGLPTQVQSNRLTGVFRRMSAGYGFVRPTGTEPNAGKSLDIYISAKNARDAASGDVVLLRLGKRRDRGGQQEGEIVEVLERETHQFVGTYFEQGGLCLVQIDGRVFTQPVLVGDPGAKGARTDDKVVVEMVRFPSHVHDGEGVILDVLGARGDPGVDTLSIIHEFNLPGDFAEDTLEAARDEAEAFDESIGDGRVDLTNRTVITIDPEDARDFDDAISLERVAAGRGKAKQEHWRLSVHIADVCHFVRPGTPLEREAFDRGTSVYLPDQVIPMLPEVISNNLASLQPDRVRYTLTAEIEFTADGARVDTEIHKAAIQSRRRFTYEEVDDYLANPNRWQKKLTVEVHALLGRMHSLAMILRRRRMKRGAIELSLPEMKIDLDGKGRVTGAHLVENTESHQIIEEFMLAANEAVAELFYDRQLTFIRRIHEAPDPRKLKDLTAFATELGFKTDSLESRFAIQKLLDAVRGLPQEHAVNYAVLRSMQKAIYSPTEEGHYALASDHYCHFTSPIRRYPDLTVHRLLEAVLLGTPPMQDVGRLAEVGLHCSEREQRAEQAERELKKVKLLDFLSHRIGEEMDGVITGVEDFGLFIAGIELPAEGFIHISSLADDYYHFDRASHTLSGRRSGNSYRLGDAVRVAVARVDVDRRQLDFRLVGRLSRVPTRHRKPSTKKPRTRQATDRGRSSKKPFRKKTGKKTSGKKTTGKKTTGKKTTGKKTTHGKVAGKKTTAKKRRTRKPTGKKAGLGGKPGKKKSRKKPGIPSGRKTKKSRKTTKTAGKKRPSKTGRRAVASGLVKCP